MHKLFKKGIAAAMGLALSLTCLVAAAVPVQAASTKKDGALSVLQADGTSKSLTSYYETNYVITDLTLSDDGRDAAEIKVTTDKDAKTVTLVASHKYQGCRFAIPQEVLAAKIIGAKIDMTAESFNFTLSAEHVDDGVLVSYGGMEVGAHSINPEYSWGGKWGTANGEKCTAADLPNIKFIGVNTMTETGTSNTIVMKSITFLTEDEVKAAGSDDKTDDKTDNKPTATGTKTKEIKLSDLKKDCKAEEGITVGDDNIKFTNGASSVFFKIPDDVLVAGLEKIELKTDYAGSIIVKLCKSNEGNQSQDDPNDAMVKHPSKEIDLTTGTYEHGLAYADVKYLGLATYEADATVNITGIVFTTEKEMVPQTGDVSHAAWMVMIALGCLALVAGTGAFVMQRKNR